MSVDQVESEAAGREVTVEEQMGLGCGTRDTEIRSSVPNRFHLRHCLPSTPGCCNGRWTYEAGAQERGWMGI